MKLPFKKRRLSGGMRPSDLSRKLTENSLDIDSNPQRLAEEMKREGGSAAPTLSAWTAFAAWCEADDGRFKLWSEVFKLSS